MIRYPSAGLNRMFSVSQKLRKGYCMNKALVALLSLVLVAALTGCSGGGSTAPGGDSDGAKSAADLRHGDDEQVSVTPADAAPAEAPADAAPAEAPADAAPAEAPAEAPAAPGSGG